MDEQREHQYLQLIRSAARRLTGHERRAFIAEVTQLVCEDNARQSERLFGWGRQTAAVGIAERDAGIRCQESFCQRGRKRTEDANPKLVQDIRELVDPHAQADPKLKNTFAYTRLTAKASAMPSSPRRATATTSCQATARCKPCSIVWDTACVASRRLNL